MRVQRVLMPGSARTSWTVLGDDHVPVEPPERFLCTWPRREVPEHGQGLRPR